MKRQTQINSLIVGGIGFLILTGCGNSQKTPEKIAPAGKMPLPPPQSNTAVSPQNVAPGGQMPLAPPKP